MSRVVHQIDIFADIPQTDTWLCGEAREDTDRNPTRKITCPKCLDIICKNRRADRASKIDWDYDFYSHAWTNSHGGLNPRVIDDCILRLAALEKHPDSYEATTDGGWPRVGWGNVLDVDMIETWPHSHKIPSVLIEGVFSYVWHPFYSLTDIRLRDE